MVLVLVVFLPNSYYHFTPTPTTKDPIMGFDVAVNEGPHKHGLEAGVVYGKANN